ncbi:hypothetical protein AYI69_g4469 [Smittium culicis]|uniref:MARVEL domain-containing protein n=1 Tax=Smittium culicis TaxID=133412 RepID=A0A1R1YDC2_9FUNG|nr:hypothetical protein AYI69_g4469 [Smittium culicis]
MAVLWISAAVSISTLINVYQDNIKMCLDSNLSISRSYCVNLIVGCAFSWFVFLLWTILAFSFNYKSKMVSEENYYLNASRGSL